MKKIYYLLFATVLTGMGACNKSNEPATDNVEKKINLSTSIINTEIAKSPVLDEEGKGNFSNGDIFSLVVANADNKYNSFDFTVGTTQLYWKDIDIAASNGKVNFSACYPKQNITEGKFSFNLSTSEEKDLLLATAKDVTVESENPVSLSFRHAMHRLKIKFNAESGIDTKEIQTKCTAKSTCSVNMMDCSIDATNASSADFTGSGEEVEFIIIPQKASDVTLEITVGKTVKTFTVNSIKPEINELEGGKQLYIELSVKEGKIEIDDATIKGWESQGTAIGEIII